MARKTAAIIWFDRCCQLLGLQFALPGTVLVRDNLHPDLHFLDGAGSIIQMTRQRDFRSPYCTPITSPTFSSCSSPENNAPELLMLRARTCCVNV